MEKSSKRRIKEQTVNCTDDGELVLRDVMDTILQYLNTKELSRVSQVCKSWKEEASKEICRRYFELKLLHGTSNKNPSFHVSDMLDNKPHVTLLFPGAGRANFELFDFESLAPYRYDPWNKDEPEEVEVVHDTIKGYRKHFPNKLIVVGVYEATMNAFVVPSLPLVYFNDNRVPNRTVSLTLPLNKQLNVVESCIFESQFDKKKVAAKNAIVNNMIESLLAGNTRGKSTLLIFASNPDFMTSTGNKRIIKSMLNSFKASLAGKSYALWGLVTPQKIYASEEYSKSNAGKEGKQTRIVGLNLSGPNFYSWSTVISVKLTKAKIDEKLNSFREKIQLKRCSLGLITAAIKDTLQRGTSEHCKLAGRVRALFPEVPFLGAFCENFESSYCAMHLSSEDPKETLSSDVITIMIISYN